MTDHYALRSKSSGKWVTITRGWRQRDGLNNTIYYVIEPIRSPSLFSRMSYIKNMFENVIYEGERSILEDLEIVIFTEYGKKPSRIPNIKALIKNAEKRVIIAKLKK